MGNDKIYDDTRNRILPVSHDACLVLRAEGREENDRLDRIASGIGRAGVPIRLILGGVAALIVALLIPGWRQDPPVLTAVLGGFLAVLLAAGYIAISGRNRRSGVDVARGADDFVPVAVPGFKLVAVRVPASWVEDNPKLLLRWYGALAALTRDEAALERSPDTAEHEKLRAHLGAEIQRHRAAERRLWKMLQRRHETSHD